VDPNRDAFSNSCCKTFLIFLPPTTDPDGVGLVPRWGNLNFDPAMLDPPDQDILSDLEQQLGWVK
jgi:hypothetical protein